MYDEYDEYDDEPEPSPTVLALDYDARYSVEGRAGVAWFLAAPCALHWDCVLAVMVGDNRRWHTDPDDLTVIDDDDYCPGCGQVGCGAYS